MRAKSLLLASLLAGGWFAQPAAALPCVGFTDVQDTDAFCGAVEWIKNRGVTTGCTATEYCPFNNVTRAQMALFMNRLGKALTPVTLHKGALGTNITVPLAGFMQCVTDDLPPASYPRTAKFIGMVHGVPTSYGGSWLQGWWMHSTDAGATWHHVGTWQVTQFWGRDWADGGQVAGFTALAPPMELAVGPTYRFGLFVNGNGGSYTFNPLVCEVDVTVNSRNAEISPLDD